MDRGSLEERLLLQTEFDVLVCVFEAFHQQAQLATRPRDVQFAVEVKTQVSGPFPIIPGPSRAFDEADSKRDAIRIFVIETSRHPDLLGSAFRQQRCNRPHGRFIGRDVVRQFDQRFVGISIDAGEGAPRTKIVVFVVSRWVLLAEQLVQRVQQLLQAWWSGLDFGARVR